MKVASIAIIIIFYVINIIFIFDIVKAMIFNKKNVREYMVCTKVWYKWFTVSLSILFNAIFLLLIIFENPQLSFLFAILIVNTVFIILLLFSVKRKIIVYDKRILIIKIIKKAKEVCFTEIGNVKTKKFDISGLIKKTIVNNSNGEKLFSFLSTDQFANALIERLKQYVFL